MKYIERTWAYDLLKVRVPLFGVVCAEWSPFVSGLCKHVSARWKLTALDPALQLGQHRSQPCVVSHRLMGVVVSVQVAVHVIAVKRAHMSCTLSFVAVTFVGPQEGLRGDQWVQMKPPTQLSNEIICDTVVEAMERVILRKIARRAFSQHLMWEYVLIVDNQPFVHLSEQLAFVADHWIQRFSCLFVVQHCGSVLREACGFSAQFLAHSSHQPTIVVRFKLHQTACVYQEPKHRLENNALHTQRTVHEVRGRVDRLEEL